MVTCALLIGFGYRDSLHPLPGTVVDLYRVYRYCTTVARVDRIVILTDLIRDECIQDLRDVIMDGLTGNDITSFISRTRQSGELIDWRSGYELGNVEHYFDGRPDELVWYFSGHGRYGNFICPDASQQPMETVLRHLALGVNKDLVWIRDCCHASDVGMPYVFGSVPQIDAPGGLKWCWLAESGEDAPRIGGMLSELGTTSDMEMLEKPRRCIEGARVLTFSSSSSFETSITSARGSPFTTALCSGFSQHLPYRDLWEHTTRCLGRQKFVFQASFPDSLEVFGWITRCGVRIHPLGGFILR